MPSITRTHPSGAGAQPVLFMWPRGPHGAASARPWELFQTIDRLGRGPARVQWSDGTESWCRAMYDEGGRCTRVECGRGRRRTGR